MSYIYAGQGNDDISDAIAMVSSCVGPIVGPTAIATTQRGFEEVPKSNPRERALYPAKGLNLDHDSGRGSKRRKSIFWDTHF